MKKLILLPILLLSFQLSSQKRKTPLKQKNDVQTLQIEESFTFCYENFTVTLTNGGSAVMKRYRFDGAIASIVPGEWTSYGSPNDLPGQTVKIKFRGSSEFFPYTLIRDGYGKMSMLIDVQSRKLIRCN